MADNRVFAGLQHPHTDDQRVGVGRNALVGLVAGVRVQFNSRLGGAERFNDLAGRDPRDRRVEADEQMRHMVCNLRNDCFCAHGRKTLHHARDPVGALLVVALHGLLGVRQNPVDRGDHAADLFLRDLHAAPNTVGRVVVPRSKPGQFLAAQQQACVLRPAHTLAARERDQVEAHAGVLPQVGDGRHVCGCVDVAGNAMLVRDAQPIFAADLRAASRANFIFGCVEEVGHHGVAGIAGTLVVVDR